MAKEVKKSKTDTQKTEENEEQEKQDVTEIAPHTLGFGGYALAIMNRWHKNRTKEGGL